MEKRLKEIYKESSLIVAIKKRSIEDYKVNLKEPSEDSADKKLFLDTIKTLDEIESNLSIIFDAGVDLSNIETMFFQVIENFLYSIYNLKQINVIHNYLYGIPFSDKAGVPVDSKGKVLNPETPEELWNAVQILK